VIVVGTSGESPIRSAMLGSTPHKLLQLSTRPVLCVPAGDSGPAGPAPAGGDPVRRAGRRPRPRPRRGGRAARALGRRRVR
jgi:hypothetical protein